VALLVSAVTAAPYPTSAEATSRHERRSITHTGNPTNRSLE
jgi:hypothetical protein